MRRLYRGDFQPELEAAFLHELAGMRRGDPLEPVVVVVPSNLLKLHLRRLAARRGCPHLNVHFLTLVDLARKLAEPELIRRGLELLPAVGREMLARDVAVSAESGSYFHDVRELAGFAAVLSAAIRDVRDCWIDASRLRAAAESRKIQDFGSLLEEYEQRLEKARFADESDLLRFAESAAEEHPFLALEHPLLVYGFYDFTSSQRRFLTAAILRAGAICFAPIKEGPAYAFAAPTLDHLDSLRFEPASPPGIEPAQTALEHLRTSLFRGCEAHVKLPRDESVRILSCPGAPREAKEIVRQVKQLVADGIPLFEIGIVTRGTGGTPLLQEAFDSLCDAAELEPEERPPLFLQGGRPLLEQRPARSFLLLLQLLERGLTRKGLFEWLFFSGHEERALSMERLARRAAVSGGRDPDAWRGRLQRLRSELETDRERNHELRRHPETDEAGRAIEDDLFAARLDDLARLEGLVQRLAALADELRSAATYRERIDLAVRGFSALAGRRPEWLELLEELLVLDRIGTPADLRTFVDAVEICLQGAGSGEGRFQQGLLIGSLLPVRGLPFRVLILPGLVDGQFPRRSAPDPILLDHERSRLTNRLLPAGDVGLPLSRRARDEDRMLFRLALAAARERLVLTYPRVEPVSGSELIPSPLLLSAAEALEGRRISISELDRIESATRVPVHPPLERLDQDALDLVEFDLGLIATAVRSGDSAAVRALTELQPTAGDALSCETARWTERRFTSFDGLLSRELARELLASPIGRRAGSPYSPSQLQEYASCPFLSFAKRILGLQEPEEEDDLVTIDALERGSLLHSILERFLAGLARSGEPFPPGAGQVSAALEQLLAEARRQFDRFEKGRAPAHPFLWIIEKQRMEADLRFFLETEIEAATDRRPALFEVRFGREGGLPALLVGPRKIPVAGSIDRVDLAADGVHATVVDYKTGSAFPWKGELAGGRKVQLPLYALALETVARPGMETVVDRAEYFFMTRKGNGTRRQAESDSWHGGDQSQLAWTVRRVVSALRRGIYLADPTDKAQCKYCSFRLVCGLGAGLEQRFERKSRQGAVRRYFELEDA